MNDELNDRGLDLNEANAFLQGVLGSIRAGVIVVNGDLVVTAWNEAAHDLWGLRGDEVLGKHLLNLDIGLPVGELRNPMRETIRSGSAQEVSVEARNRRGRNVEMKVSLMPLLGNDARPRGVIMLMHPDGTDGTGA